MNKKYLSLLFFSGTLAYAQPPKERIEDIAEKLRILKAESAALLQRAQQEADIIATLEAKKAAKENAEAELARQEAEVAKLREELDAQTEQRKILERQVDPSLALAEVAPFLSKVGFALGITESNLQNLLNPKHLTRLAEAINSNLLSWRVASLRAFPQSKSIDGGLATLAQELKTKALNPDHSLKQISGSAFIADGYKKLFEAFNQAGQIPEKYDFAALMGSEVADRMYPIGLGCFDPEKRIFINPEGGTHVSKKALGSMIDFKAEATQIFLFASGIHKLVLEIWNENPDVKKYMPQVIRDEQAKKSAALKAVIDVSRKKFEQQRKEREAREENSIPQIDGGAQEPAAEPKSPPSSDHDEKDV